MFALRLTCPPHATDAVVSLLYRHPAATHLVLLRGAGLEPAGDVVLVDLAREAVSEVLGELRALPGGADWPFALENVDTTLSPYADEAERVAPGLGVDAVVWEEVEARTSEESELSGSFLALMVLATFIAAVGVLLDSPVLVVGAMVVGPEFGAVAGLTVALVQRRWDRARRSLRALAVGFPLAAAGALVLTRVVIALGDLPPTYAGGAAPPHRVHQPARRVRGARRTARRGRRRRLPDERQVGRPRRRGGERHDDPRRGRRGGRGRGGALVGVRRRRRPAGGQPGGAGGGRRGHPRAQEARFTPLTIARSEDVTMLGWTPQPQSTRPPTATSR